MSKRVEKNDVHGGPLIRSNYFQVPLILAHKQRKQSSRTVKGEPKDAQVRYPELSISFSRGIFERPLMEYDEAVLTELRAIGPGVV